MPCDRESNLVLSVDREGFITRVNDDFETIIGYKKNEVLFENFSDFIASPEEKERWVNFFAGDYDSSTLDEFEISIQSKDGTIIPVVWNGFAVKKPESCGLDRLGLVGTIGFVDTSNIKTSMKTSAHTQKRQSNKSTSETKKHISKQDGTKKNRARNKQPSDYIQKVEPKNDKQKNKTKSNKKRKGLPKIKVNKSKFKDTKKSKKQAIKDKSKSELVEELKRLKKERDDLKNKYQETNEKTDISSSMTTLKNIKSFTRLKTQFILDCVGVNKKRKEFHQMMEELNSKKQTLLEQQASIDAEKNEFQEKANELYTWRKKLEQLEGEIEKRRQYLQKQEQFAHQQLNEALKQQMKTRSCSVGKKTSNPYHSEGGQTRFQTIDDFFDNISDSAVVLHRGKIKKANEKFLNLLEYDSKEIVEKSFIDFISPSGIEGVEKHYLDQLKGVDASVYRTVFLSKHGMEIPVEISTIVGNFNGERVEMAKISPSQ